VLPRYNPLPCNRHSENFFLGHSLRDFCCLNSLCLDCPDMVVKRAKHPEPEERREFSLAS
jgi:hypothetical protein